MKKLVFILPLIAIGIASTSMEAKACSGWYKVGIAIGYYQRKYGYKMSSKQAAAMCRNDPNCQHTIRKYCD